MEKRLVDIHTHRPHPDKLTIRTFGIHPWDAGREDIRLPGELPAGTQAIGEIGLDYASPVDRSRQEALLRAQLALAEKSGLPVVLHCVRAFEPLMRILSAYRLRAVIFHGFIGSCEQAGQALRRGYWLSFGERSLHSPRTTEVLRTIPGERLFIETDDSPTAIGTIYRQAARVRETTVEELAATTEQNYKRIFDR